MASILNRASFSGALWLIYLAAVALADGLARLAAKIFNYDHPPFADALVMLIVSSSYLIFISISINRLRRRTPVAASARLPNVFLASPEIVALSAVIDEQRDQIRQLREEIELCRDQQERRDNHVQTEAHVLTDTVLVISDSVLRSSSAISQLAGAAEAATGAADRMNKIADRFTNGVSEMNGETRMIADTVANAVVCIEDIQKTVVDAVEYASNTAQEMKTLGNEFLKELKVFNILTAEILTVDQILDVIDEVADQTKMLALNAAIEAARSGRHGVGFGVVADAIRDLSVKIGSSTTNVKTTIKNIQSRARETLIGLEDGHHIARKTVSTAEKSRARAETAVKKTEDLHAMLKNIELSANRQAAEANELNVVAKSAWELTQSVSASIIEQAGGLSDIIGVVTQIQETTDKLREIETRIKQL